MKNNRVEEIMGAMKSFGKDSYHKSELLSEMFALQQEIVELTFNGDHASTADLKIWDVERHLEQLNEKCDHASDEELRRFKEGSKILCNLIKAEISGHRGEFKAFKTLEYLKSENRVLRNVELSDGDVRTELDAVVITPKCLTIVEVKNTAKNIFIDEEGNYFRTGEFLKLDCNIAEKMSVKEELLRKTLEKAGAGYLPIRSIVVFTNNRIEVQNRFRQIRTCFVSKLAYIIDGFHIDDSITTEKMGQIQESVELAECKGTYSMEFDVQQYKKDFANLMAMLETASSVAKEQEQIAEIEKYPATDLSTKITFVKVVKSLVTSKKFRYVGSTAAAVAITVTSGLIAANTFSK